MIRKLPIAAAPIGIKDALFLKPVDQREFSAAFSSYSGSEHVYPLDSGISSFYVILKALGHIDARDEVILPAFTAGTLIVAIRKAGLKPVLCDVSMDDFNMDTALAASLIGRDTLALLGIHMFGIVNTKFSGMKKAFPNVYMIEDCAQAEGSLAGGKLVGSMGDASFFSFNKGKNMPLFKGGCIATDNERLAAEIEVELRSAKICNGICQASLRLKMALLSLVADPAIYALLYNAIGLSKGKKPPHDFDVRNFTPLQAAYGLMLLKKMNELAEKRYKNGMRLLNGLKGLDAVLLPKISPDTRPAFNRLPIVFKDLGQRESVKKELWRAGIETCLLYPKPLHHKFELGYEREAFPNATYIATHSWTFPVHQGVGDGDIDRMIEIIRSIVE
jgi:dTDP-4-amino-4,6-dideoxygalactose transaminase